MSLFWARVPREDLGITVDVNHLYLCLVALAVLALLYKICVASDRLQSSIQAGSATTNFLKFFYASFLKPHSRASANVGQQGALESFYKAQVSSFDRS